MTLAELLRGTETKASGRVQLLTLADFRAHIGGLWDTYGDKIVLIAESTIARMIEEFRGPAREQTPTEAG